MLVDIFSCFDDNNLVFMSLSSLVWGFSLSLTALLVYSYWAQNTRYWVVYLSVKEVMFSQAGRTLGAQLGGFDLLIVVLFSLLVFLNLSGMVPYVFSPTSHLVFSFSMGLPFWFSLIVSGWVHNPTSAVASLLPMGAPAPLNPFLVLIETVSISVRPITLSVRLAANMSAGHIILGLVGNYMMAASSTESMLFLVLVQVFYSMLEFAICAIQAYIFCLLLTLYSDEHTK
uniref:ATP synthase subunit a n=1 Tax=Eualetes tulipa TaxID=765164 RepID=E2FLT3_9CAEN|nr:ATP synthase F0 subunit 6 [Eualetes tulipa]ADI79399.1 ATP synthase F0 subunit 6 [Eualetes tulipa]